jgi:hypothetical protein
VKPTEAVTLARIVRGFCPQQALDEYTADAYVEVLGGLPLKDCADAVRALGRVQSFISAAEIYQEVRKVRNKRLSDYGDPTPPPDLTPLETIAWLRKKRRQIADGEATEDEYAGELKARHLPDLRVVMPGTDVSEGR